MSEILAKALRTFHGEEGHKDPYSEPFPVSRQRFADLKANGLVEEVAPAAEKAAPAPENKMMPESANKAAAAPKTKAT